MQSTPTKPIRRKVLDIRTNKYGQVWYTGKVDASTKKPHGQGRRFYSNGDVLNGEWKDGRPEKGCLSFDNDRRWIEGSFKGGLLEGECIESEDGVQVYKGAFKKGRRDQKQNSEPTPEEYSMQLRKDLFDLWLFEMRRFSFDKKGEKDTKQAEKEYLYTYLSPFNLLIDERVMNEYLKTTDDFIKERNRFASFDECVFALDKSIIRYNCDDRKARIYTFGAEECLVNNNWRSFLKLYNNERPSIIVSDTGTLPLDPLYEVVEVKCHQPAAFSDQTLRKTIICYVLKLIAFENFHSVPMPKQLAITPEQIQQFQIELFNAIIYNRNTLELTNEDSQAREELNKEKEKN